MCAQTQVRKIFRVVVVVVVDVPSKITNLKAKGCLPLGKKKGVFHS